MSQHTKREWFTGPYLTQDGNRIDSELGCVGRMYGDGDADRVVSEHNALLGINPAAVGPMLGLVRELSADTFFGTDSSVLRGFLMKARIVLTLAENKS